MGGDFECDDPRVPEANDMISDDDAILALSGESDDNDDTRHYSTIAEEERGEEKNNDAEEASNVEPLMGRSCGRMRESMVASG